MEPGGRERALGFRQKLTLAFGGLLALLFVVGTTSILLLARYSATLETIFRENYDTVLYARHMQEAIDVLDDLAEASLWNEDAVNRDTQERASKKFELNLRAELGNITLPGEAEAARELSEEWNEYRTNLDKLFERRDDMRSRREFYRSLLLPQAQAAQATAQRVIDINLANMLSVDGQVRAQAARSRRTMIALMLVGALLAVTFTIAITRSILKPLRTLTRSVREVEQGNLDLAVPLTSRDELGELAEAFNAMAARLREFRRSDQARLARTQRTTQLALNSFPDAVAVVSPDGKVELANETARRLFDLEPGFELHGTSFATLKEMFDRTISTLERSIPRGYEAAIRVFDTGEHYFQPQAVPILAEDRALVGVTLVLTDVTNLRHLDQAKSGLISVVSHELKTPLTSIRMATHLLLERNAGPLTERQAGLLTAAREDSDRLCSIIDSLLDIGRIESGSQLMELMPSRIDEIMENAARTSAAAYAAKPVALEVDVEPSIPPVLADVDRLGHVFANLLDNALRYSPENGRVRLSARRDGDFVLISVEDSGSGIAASDLPRIFDRFYRAPSQSPQSGAGLGLAIVKEIVEAHGGAVSVESVPGGGSTFRFTLRLASGARTPSRP